MTKIEGKELYERLNRHTPVVMERFARDVLFKKEDILPEERYEALFSARLPVFEEAVETLLSVWDAPEHRQTLGHDRTHIAFDLFEYLQLVTHVNLPRSEQVMVLFGSLLHDLGRYPEMLFQERSEGMDFKLSKQIQLHAAFSGYIGALLARNFTQFKSGTEEEVETARSFVRRVIGAVLLHGGKNIEQDAAIGHQVQTVDRLAGVLGVREFARNVICDGAQRGAPFYPDDKLDFSYDFPRFNNLPADKFKDAATPGVSWTNIFHYLEMPMRNLFPLASEFATKRARKMGRQSGIILTFLSGGSDTSLYRQTFAPELSRDRERFKFPKTPLPREIWEKIYRGPTQIEIAEMAKLQADSTDVLIDKMLAQQAPDITVKDREKVHMLCEAAPAAHKGDVHSALQYVVARRRLDKREEGEFLVQTLKESADPLVGILTRALLAHPLWS